MCVFTLNFCVFLFVWICYDFPSFVSSISQAMPLSFKQTDHGLMSDETLDWNSNDVKVSCGWDTRGQYSAICNCRQLNERGERVKRHIFSYASVLWSECFICGETVKAVWVHNTLWMNEDGRAGLCAEHCRNSSVWDRLMNSCWNLLQVPWRSEGIRCVSPALDNAGLNSRVAIQSCCAYYWVDLVVRPLIFSKSSW